MLQFTQHEICMRPKYTTWIFKSKVIETGEILLNLNIWEQGYRNRYIRYEIHPACNLHEAKIHHLNFFESKVIETGIISLNLNIWDQGYKNSYKMNEIVNWSAQIHNSSSTGHRIHNRYVFCTYGVASICKRQLWSSKLYNLTLDNFVCVQFLSSRPCVPVYGIVWD